MKISNNWLSKYIKTGLKPSEISPILTDTGLEIEGMEEFVSVTGGLEGLVIGKVLSCQKHPNADTLSLTTVDIGADELLPIVCGAPNVGEGQTVVVAPPGVIIYPTDGEPFKIKRAKIRGEESQGMICAEDEIGLGTEHDGIIVIDANVKPGTPAKDYFKIEFDTVYEIGLTPNRGDATSHIGVARDLKAVLDKPVLWPSVEAFSVDKPGQSLKITVKNTEACPRYSGVCLDGLTVKESPDWLKNKLKSIGLTPINNIVDVTNFVLHETGQPLHAFDFDKIEGREIIVDTRKEGSKFTTLDGVERTLHSTDLMINNKNDGMCIGGVFGGIKSGVTEQTTAIFLECAYFSMDWIRRTALAHGLKTDASFRFERGVDPEKTVYAMKRAALLMKEVAGGTISSDIYDIYPKPVEPVRVEVKYDHVTRLIGKEIPREEIHRILHQLDIMSENAHDDQFVAVIPAYRNDVTREADVIEEILRIYGLNNVELPDHLSSSFLAEFPETDPRFWRSKISQTLNGKGFYEIMTNSLTKPEYSDLVKEINSEENIEILNKLSEDLGVLRQSMLFTGLEVVRFNLNRQQTDLKLFEFGKVYSRKNGEYIEAPRFSIFISGNTTIKDWRNRDHKSDFFDLKAIVFEIISSCTNAVIVEKTGTNSIFSLNEDLFINDKLIASFGKVSGHILKKLEIKQEIFYGEIDWELLLRISSNNIEFKEIPRFPEVNRDLSLVLNRNVSFADIKTVASKYDSRIVKKINLFDVYEGERIDKDKKAYAVSFVLQDEKKTLTDKEIDKTMRKLMDGFEKELGALIRK